MTKDSIRVLIVDDELLVREGLAMLIGSESDLEVVGSTGDGQEALNLAGQLRPDVVVMDVRMPGTDGVEATRALVAEDRSKQGLVRVLIVSSFHEDQVVHAALRSGASGFLLKSAAPRSLADAVRHVAGGDAWLDPIVARQLLSDFAARADPLSRTPQEFSRLTAREREVLVLLAHGLGTNGIVEHLVISEATVKTHISRILLKLGLHDRSQAVAAAYRGGLVGPGDALPQR